MARLTLQPSKKKSAAHRVAQSEGESAIRLLQENGYPSKRRANGQSEHCCPAHEEPGVPKRGKTNFYVDIETSKFQCHSASCGFSGNLITLERHFGVDPAYSDSTFVTKEQKLQKYEQALQDDPELREVFHEDGINDETIKRFRLGYDKEKDRYVIPYLDGKTPVCFRYYNPEPSEYFDKDGNKRKQLKYYWETGATAIPYNFNDGVGDDKGRVILCEGEKKAMALVQIGYNAVATPGAGMFKDEWHQYFTDCREIVICFDNDNPEHPDNQREIGKCKPCMKAGLEECRGHNPGQDAARKVENILGWRARNVVLPLPDRQTKKTDVNEYFVRDGHTAAEFAEFVFGEKAEPYKVRTLAEIMDDPPEEASMLVEHGILPKGGRLLVAGKPKAGKSIFIENLALSVAAGIPFLGQFDVSEPSRVLLLDRELSRRSLYERLTELIKYRPGYRVGVENLAIDHEHLLKIDRKGAYDVLERLVTYNGADVVIFDTAYKFFAGSIDSSTAMTAAFEVLDKLIAETGVSVVMTHHHKKSQNKGSSNEDHADPDNVAGSFLWTGWPNASILLNFMGNSIENPFNTVCTFTAFRDAAPPEPLALYRERDSISYSAIRPVSPAEAVDSTREKTKPSTEAVMTWLFQQTPIPRKEAEQGLSDHFFVSPAVVRPYLIDALTTEYFVTKGHNEIIHYYQDEPETWDDERQLRLVKGEAGNDVNQF